jgi:4-hydroxybenzoate polyprenyltransferase
LSAFIKSLRPYQWSKNLLLAVPPIAAQVWTQPGVMQACLLGFAAFSLAASGGYIINDLVDIAADRRHPVKRFRPFAAGQLKPALGMAAGPVLLLTGLALAFASLNNFFGTVLLAYVILALAYSLILKRRLLLDVIVLAGLYAIRLVAGGAAVGVTVSAWLLAFSMFFFLSIAFAKRMVELDLAGEESPARAYGPTDKDAIRIVGPACGLMSILVLALYISSDVVNAMYAEPDWLWLLCLLMLYWILRFWFLAMRGTLHHDPVLFALRDAVSYLVGLATLLVLYLASQ